MKTEHQIVAGNLSAKLLCSLPIDVEEHVLAGGQGRLHGGACGVP